jgi:hypothetical protein
MYVDTILKESFRFSVSVGINNKQQIQLNNIHSLHTLLRTEYICTYIDTMLKDSFVF